MTPLELAQDLIAAVKRNGACPLCGVRMPECAHILWARRRGYPVELRIQPIVTSGGSIYYASDDGEIILSMQGKPTLLSRPETMQLELPLG